MCSLNDCLYDGNNDEINKNGKDSLMNTVLCRKCRSEDIDVLMIGQSGYCKTCFLTITNHKFRAALGKSKIIRHGDFILVDHSGELSSTVLLHLIKSGMSESTHKKLIFKTIVIFIDDDTMGRTIDERNILKDKIAKEIKNYGFSGYIVSLNQVLSQDDDTLDIKSIDQEICHEQEDRLHTILDNLSDNTSRLDLLNQLRRRLLVSAARKLGCNKVFVADSAMDIAAKVLGDVCLGRGAQLSMLASFCDTRCVDIKILKPLRNFTQQELVYYSEHYKIKPAKSKESNVTVAATSIQVLAHNFTAGLESQFSGTVSTIFRTAEKISPRINVQQDAEDNCVLCGAKLDTMSFSDQVSAVRAIEVSRLLSSNIETKIFNNEENGELDSTTLCPNDRIYCNDNVECGCKNGKERKIIVEDVWRYLCYSCRLIFRKSEILNTLPVPLLSAVKQRLALKSMREEIDDFLL